MSSPLLFFGTIALQKGFLSKKQLEEALEVQRNLQKIGFHEKIGVICIRLGFLSQKEVDTVLEEQRKGSLGGNLRYLYGKIALANQLIQEEQLKECLEEQHVASTYAPIGHYLMKKGYLSFADHHSILRAIDRLSSQAAGERLAQILQEEEFKDYQDFQYGKIALEQGTITSEQMEEALNKKGKERIWQYLLKKRYITLREHYWLLSILEKRRRSEREARKEELRQRILFRHGAGKKTAILKVNELYQKSQTQKLKSPLPEWLELPFQKDPSFFPEYELIRPLGYGGMAVVYHGRHKASGKEVAMKILPPAKIALQLFGKELSEDPKRLERFHRESEILSQLSHPHIVKLLSRGEHEGYHYYTMEYVPGTTLSDLLAEVGSLEEHWALEIAQSIAMALCHLWEFRVVHRDLKPENIFLGCQGEIFLFDFGLAKSLEEGHKHMTSHDTILGTPAYMAPEQTGLLRGYQVDIRTDVYALGATLYDMVIGEPPFYDESPLKTMVMHLKEEVPLACEIRKEVSRQTSELICRMMAKKPEERFSHPREVVDAIQEIRFRLRHPS